MKFIIFAIVLIIVVGLFLALSFSETLKSQIVSYLSGLIPKSNTSSVTVGNKSGEPGTATTTPTSTPKFVPPGFHGPTSPPSVVGPSGPPPDY